MTDPDLIGLFIAPLERMGVPYMITGGVASVVYGDPRFTRDVDVVLQLAAAGAADFVNYFDEEAFYLPPEAVISEEAGREAGGHFNVIHRESALRADVYLAGSDPLHEWAFGRRRRIELDQRAVWLAPLEYVIVRKLEYLRSSGWDRHLRDVAMMLRISGDLIDEVALRDWTGRLDLANALEAAREYPDS